MAENQPGQDGDHGDGSPGNIFAEAGMAETWRSGAAARVRAFGAATELMLDLADLKPGDRVLDVAAGTGEQSLVAAKRVGPSGQVLATDISEAMLRGAAEEIARAGLTNVETRVMDAQALDLASDSFDAAISRMGLMLIPDRQQALAEIRRVLKPGGKLAVIVWSTGEKNLSMLLPTSIARRHAKLPPPTPGGPGVFALAPPGLLARTLTEAGFRDVAVQPVPAPRRFGSAAEMTRFLAETSPALREPLSKVDEAGRAAMLAEIEETMRQFEGPDGVTISGEVLVGVGTK